jgi:hypothetical protein
MKCLVRPCWRCLGNSVPHERLPFLDCETPFFQGGRYEQQMEIDDDGQAK